MFGPRSKQPEEKPDVKPEPERVLTAEEEVYALRYIRLLALGLPPDDALLLIGIPDVARDAERLYANVCPPHLIVELLK